jgi:hypothetical protein
VSSEHVSAFSGVRVALDSAEFTLLLVQLNSPYAGPFAKFRDVVSRFGNKLIREKVAVAVKNGETGGDISCRRHWFDTSLMCVDPKEPGFRIATQADSGTAGGGSIFGKVFSGF